MHGKVELSTPHHILVCRELLAKCESAVEHNPDRPVDALAKVARVLDVVENITGGEADAEFIDANTLDSLTEWLAVTHGAAREVPEAGAWTYRSPCQHNTAFGSHHELDGQSRNPGEDLVVLIFRQGINNHCQMVRATSMSADGTLRRERGPCASAQHDRSVCRPGLVTVDVEVME